jgi:biopolymer transport protein ExbD
MPLVRLAEDDDPQPNLAPMIDVVLVLTIFFMCATRFSGDEHAFDVELPKVKAASPVSAAKPEIVEVSADGTVLLRGEPVAVGDLSDRLVALRGDRPDLSVLVRGDHAANHGRMAMVYEACRTAGIRHVGISVQVSSTARGDVRGRGEGGGRTR